MKKKISVKACIALISVITVFLLSAFLFRDLSFVMPLSQEVSVTVSATGEKNASSKSSEVWIYKISADEIDLELSQFKNDRWTIMEGGELYSNNGSFVLNATVYEELKIYFAGNAYSGICEVVTSDETIRRDLYRLQSATIDVPITPLYKEKSYLSIFLPITAIACLYVFVVIKMRKRIATEGFTFKAFLRHLITPAITPLLFMFYLYYQNKEYLDYLQVLVVALIFALISVLLYFAVSRLFNCRSASIIITAWWGYFFMFNSLHERLWASGTPGIFFFVTVAALLLLILGIALLFTYIKKIEVYTLISVMLTVIFLMNFIPSTYNYIINKVTVTDDLYKTDFVIDETASHPNVYWFHTDGMMSFASVERTFGDMQNEFRQALQARGFVINEDAYFEAGHATHQSMPLFLSPQYYDTSGEALFTPKELETISKYNDYLSVFQNQGLSFKQDELQEVRMNFEIFKAFTDAGYYTNVRMYEPGKYFDPVTVSRIYDVVDHTVFIPEASDEYGHSVANIAQGLHSLNDLLGKATATVFVKERFDKVIDKWFALKGEQYPLEKDGESEDLAKSNWHTIAALKDILSTPSPSFSFILLDATHRPFIYDEDGLVVNINGEGENIKHYMSSHRFTAKLLLAMIDMIYEKDPDAVIVIQSDHGIHHYGGAQQMLDDWGFTMQQVRDVWNGVMSAVRIPEKYGGLDAPLDPLNITRELVNRYVGQNYELLPADHPNQRKPYLTDEDWTKWDYNTVANN